MAGAGLAAVAGVARVAVVVHLIALLPELEAQAQQGWVADVR